MLNKSSQENVHISDDESQDDATLDYLPNKPIQ